MRLTGTLFNINLTSETIIILLLTSEHFGLRKVEFGLKKKIRNQKSEIRNYYQLKDFEVNYVPPGFVFPDLAGIIDTDPWSGFNYRFNPCIFDPDAF